jgi:prophage regulatory protein
MVILLTDEVIEQVKLSRPTLARMERAGQFPKRVQISARRVGWISTEIDDWIEKQAGRKVRKATDQEEAERAR